MAFNRVLFSRLYIYIDFILSVLYRHFNGLTACHSLTRLTACNLSAPFQPFHALNECDGVRHLATMEREQPTTPPENENAGTAQPRDQERAQPNKTNTNTNGDHERQKLKFILS